MSSKIMVTETYALEIRNVHFHYKHGQSILNGIDLTVPRGGIYGLLGSSGCGKTTLLRCALGRLQPKSGHISLFGRKPGSKESRVPGPGVGYMPQELALFGDFSIEETLIYFGRLFGLSKEVVDSRIDFMIGLLQLPFKQKLINQLSGGQKRRVSMATAFLHNPPLLILDEPTVGVDLILREAIWKYLELLCKSGLTVILTTHYIEEARTASKVGFMRSGKLLAEDSPEELLKTHSLNTLEAVFLRLSQLEDEQKATISLTFSKDSKPLEIITDKSEICLKVMKNFRSSPQLMIGYTDECHQNNGFVSDSTNSLESLNVVSKNYNLSNGVINVKQDITRNETTFHHRLIALTLKNFRQMSRNVLLLLFFVFLPSIEISLLIMCIGQDIKHIPISVYNPEVLDKSSSLSELFLSSIDEKHISLLRYQTLESAIQAVKRNEVWAVIHFHKNFTDALKMRSLLSTDSDEDIINSSSIRLQIDMSNQVIGFQIQRHIFEAFLKFVGALAQNFGVNPEALKPPIIIDPPIYGVPKQSLISFIAPGALIVVAYFATTVMTTHLLIKERNDGLVERSLVAGVTAFEFVLSHIILQTLLLAFQVGFKLIVAFLIFTIPNSGSLISAVILTFLQGICGLMFGLMISAVCHDEIYANTLGIGAFFPSVMIGGIFWPLESMPTVLRYLSQCLPSTLAIETLRCILLRGWGLEHNQVLIGYIITILWLLFFLTNALIFFKKKL